MDSIDARADRSLDRLTRSSHAHVAEFQRVVAEEPLEWSRGHEMTRGDTRVGKGDTPCASALGITREDMIARIRDSLDTGRPSRPEPPSIDQGVARLVAQSEDLVSVFATNATAGGMSVRRLRSDDLESAVAEKLQKADARTVSVACDDSHFADVVVKACERVRIRIIRPDSGFGFDPHYEAQVGVTDVDCAVAETGSLVISSTARRGRAPLLVPPIHFAIVPASKVVADLLDVWSSLRGNRVVESRSAVVLVSGPSKTGDIEGVLVTGVHGPGEVHVLLVNDM